MLGGALRSMLLVGAAAATTTAAPRVARADDAPDCAALRALEPLPMRMLTLREYRATVAALLGETEQTLASFRLPPDPRVNGLDGYVGVTGVSADLFERLLGVGSALVDRVLEDPARAERLFGCAAAASTRDPCARAFITRFGRRAFRRPLLASEVERFSAVAAGEDGGASAWRGLATATAAMLASPAFLFRFEQGAAVQGCAEARRLNGYELATRLSFLVSGAGPSDTLLDLAATGQLDNADGLERAARELLQSAQGREGVRTFLRQWLHLDRLAARDLQDDLEDWIETMRPAFTEETQRLLDSAAWTPGADFLDVFTTRTTWVNAPMARLYGLPEPPGSTWQQVTWDVASERAGLLTHASFLAVTAPHNDAGLGTIIRRGVFVRNSLLCEPPTPPPAVLLNPDPDMVVRLPTVRERVAAHTADPTCASCHQRFDPVGMGFERFDHVGRLSPRDREGNELSGEGRLVGFSPENFRGVAELAARLRSLPEVSDCAATQWYRWAFGHTEGVGDGASLQRLRRSFAASGHSITELVVATVRSDVFRYRRVDAAVTP